MMNPGGPAPNYTPAARGGPVGLPPYEDVPRHPGPTGPTGPTGLSPQHRGGPGLPPRNTDYRGSAESLVGKVYKR